MGDVVQATRPQRHSELRLKNHCVKDAIEVLSTGTTGGLGEGVVEPDGALGNQYWNEVDKDRGLTEVKEQVKMYAKSLDEVLHHYDATLKDVSIVSGIEPGLPYCSYAGPTREVDESIDSFYLNSYSTWYDAHVKEGRASPLLRTGRSRPSSTRWGKSRCTCFSAGRGRTVGV